MYMYMYMSCCNLQSSVRRVEVEVLSGGGAGQQPEAPASLTTDSEGSFCTMLQSGKYIITVQCHHTHQHQIVKGVYIYMYMYNV